MRVFQYVIFHVPAKEQREKGEKPKFLSGTKESPFVTEICEDEKKAVLLANRAIPEEYIDKLDQLEIAVRPF